MKALVIEILVVVILGVAGIIEGIRLILAEKHSFDILGPGFYSVGLGSLWIITGLIYFVSEWKKTAKIEGKKAVAPATGRSEYQKKMISMFVIMIAYLVLLDLTGYLFATLVFFLLINRTVGVRSWLTNVGISILTTASFYLLFVTWLGMIFPRGLLFDF